MEVRVPARKKDGRIKKQESDFQTHTVFLWLKPVFILCGQTPLITLQTTQRSSEQAIGYEADPLFFPLPIHKIFFSCDHRKHSQFLTQGLWRLKRSRKIIRSKFFFHDQQFFYLYLEIKGLNR